MDERFLDVDAADLANWLESQGDAYWTIDGDDQFLDTLDLPSTAHELAGHLRRRGGRVRVFVGPGRGSVPVQDDLGAMAIRDDGLLMFDLAWVKDGAASGRWVLARATLLGLDETVPMAS